MAYTVVNLGTNADGSTGTCSLTGITVPAGATIVVFVFDHVTGTINAPGDPVNGSYTNIAGAMSHPNNSAASGTAAIYYLKGVQALTNSSIIWNKIGTAEVAGISAFYILGAGALDNNVTAASFGNGTQITFLTSNTPSGPNELFIGAVAYDNSSTCTQDSTNAAWTTPFNQVSGIGLFGGHVTNATQSTLTYSPTLGATGLWAAYIVGFAPAVGSLLAGCHLGVSATGVSGRDGSTNINADVSVTCPIGEFNQ